VTQRIEELKLLETQLRDLRSRCTQEAGVDNCRILDALACPAFTPEKLTSKTECVHIDHIHERKKNGKV